MHLGLIDRPFVPHNLISAQKSPVPLPKFQVALRLKILMSSGSKKGTQIHYPFLSKSPGKRIPSRFLNGAPMERDTCLKGIFTFLLIYLVISKALRKEQPLCKQTLIPEPYLIYFSGSPVMEPFLYVPLVESLWREMPHSYNPPSFIIQSPRYMSPPPD
jgi:hypothetical protein